MRIRPFSLSFQGDLPAITSTFFLSWPISLPIFLKMHQLHLADIPLFYGIGSFFWEILFALSVLLLVRVKHDGARKLLALPVLLLMVTAVVLHGVYMKLGLFYQPGHLTGETKTLAASIAPFLDLHIAGRLSLVLGACLVGHAVVFFGSRALIRGFSRQRLEQRFAFAAAAYLAVAAVWFEPRYEEQNAAVKIMFSGFLDHSNGSQMEAPTPAKEALFRAGPVAQFPELPPGKRYNLVVYSMESTRALSCGAYGTDLDTTPFLSSVKDDGLFFERCYSNSTRSIKALTTMMLGIYPHYSISAWSPRPIHKALEKRHLVDILNQEDYHTAFFVNSHLSFDAREMFLKNLALDHAQGTEVFISEDDSVLVDQLDNHFKAADQKDEPLFSMLLSSSGHAPYPFPGNPIGKDDAFAEAERLGIDQGAYNYYRYLNTVHHQDDVAGKLYDYLQKAGRLDDTIFVVVGDHGESFGEHGALGGFGLHGAALFEESVHVPLWIHHPDLKPQRISYPVQFLDFMPTWLAMMGIQTDYHFQGRNMLLEPREYVFMTNHVKGRVVAVLQDNLKLVRYRNADDPQRFYQLYDLKADPLEKRDLGAKHPQFSGLKEALAAADWFFPSIQQHYEDIYFGRKPVEPAPQGRRMTPWSIEVRENVRRLPAGRRLIPHLPKSSNFRIKLQFKGLHQDTVPVTVRYFNQIGDLIARDGFPAEAGRDYWLTKRDNAASAELIMPAHVEAEALLVAAEGFSRDVPLVDRLGDRLTVGGRVDEAVAGALVVSGWGSRSQEVEVTVKLDESLVETHRLNLPAGGRELVTFNLAGADRAQIEVAGKDLAAYVLRWSASGDFQ